LTVLYTVGWWSFIQTIGGPAFVDCSKRFLDGEALLRSFLRTIDLATTHARKISLEKNASVNTRGKRFSRESFFCIRYFATRYC